MAELIVSPLLEVLFDKLSSLISREYRLLSGVNKDLEALSKILHTIKDVLVDAEEKQIVDKRTRVWLKELKDAAYDTEDILDECQLEALGPEPNSGDTNCTKQVRDSFSACFNFKQILFRHKMGKRIKELIERFGEIDAGRSKFQLSQGVPVIEDEGLGRNRETSAILTEPKTYGRDEVKKTIIQILLDNSKSLNALSICPIVGIGGLGKTTLAQLVYKDDAVVNHFDTKIWICVSEDFSVKRITKMIIDHLNEKKCDLEDLSPMQNLLKKLLNERKFLLVLDDVWDDKQGNWNAIIMSLLGCGGRGSSIIVTTRLPTVVDAITPLSTSCVINPTCYLKSLEKEDSWSLFQNYALAVKDKEKEDLIDIGREIVEKCKGVPLAIKAVGSLLNSKRENFWRLVRDSETWHLEEHGETSILPALRLSYHHLPPQFRQCFAYCSVYPKDFIMKKQSLIHQWMANGFIQSSRGTKEEDVGDDIFNGLLQRSFFQDSYEDKNTDVVSCKMHDLLHDLACSITKDECWRIKTSEMGNVLQRARHVSVTCDIDSNPFNTLNKFLEYQTFFRTLMFTEYITTSLSQFSGVKCLRVLDLGDQWCMRSVPSWIGDLKLLKYLNLQNTGIALLPESICRLTNLQVLLLGRNPRVKELPSSVGKLKNLRYLDLSKTSIEELPESISTLTNLQTLTLLFCPKLNMLPREMKNMKSLRHLIIEWDMYTVLLIRSMPVGIGKLINLEKLGVFVVSNASEGAAGIQELGTLNQLKGSLIIENIRLVCDPKDAQQANLKNKNRVLQLKLYWNSGEVSSEDAENKEETETSNQVLESLEPHPNIQELLIWEYPGVELPSWVRNCALTLPNLRKLELCFMRNVVHDLHQLPPNLKTLWILDCPELRLHPKLRFPSSIKKLSLSASNDPTLRSVETLPHLSTLHISGFRENETLSRLQNLTCLQDMWIGNCSNVKRILPKLPNLTTTLQVLSISYCGDLDCITELRNLASLRALTINDCKGLTSLFNTSSTLPHFTSLSLMLFKCPKLELSVVDFQHLVALQHLHIQELPQLTSLPGAIQHVMTLQSLFIDRCMNLRMLPEWLQQHFPPSLHYLEIKGCHPELHKRCEVEKGEDWHKISHLQLGIME